MKRILFAITLLVAVSGCASTVPGGRAEGALSIQEQGSFAVGGTVVSTPGVFDPRKPAIPAGQMLHGDHAYVFYQKPVNAKKIPAHVSARRRAVLQNMGEHA